MSCASEVCRSIHTGALKGKKKKTKKKTKKRTVRSAECSLLADLRAFTWRCGSRGVNRCTGEAAQQR